MWIWKQSKGELWRNGDIISRGYSGYKRGKNNPSLQGVIGIGPIPRGKWKIVEVYNSAQVGPFAITLHAVDAALDDRHDLTGRNGFRIHGDSIKSPGNASHGCIILPRYVREKIWNSKDRELLVTE